MSGVYFIGGEGAVGDGPEDEDVCAIYAYAAS